MKASKTIIACESLRDSLEKHHQEQKGVQLVFLSQELHRQPKKLHLCLQDAINRHATQTEQIVLGYGLCCNATARLKAPQIGLVIPRVHDCISLYMGGKEKYFQLFRKYPGTYFLTPAWIRNQKDPLGAMENEYTRRVGKEMAREAMETELKNYNYIAFINENTKNTNLYRERAKENAAYFNMKYLEIDGDDSFIKKILEGPYHQKEFVILNPNEESKQSEFLK